MEDIMHELVQVSKNCYYVDSPSKIGVVKIGENEVCLIDSGNDKDAAKRLKRVLDSEGLVVKMILNTHSHADHIGGNKYFYEHTGCEIYARGAELGFVRTPILEPTIIYGAFPPDDLRHKFLLAEPTDAKPLTEDILPAGLEMLPLPGHFLDMVGFRTEDGIVFLADSLASPETLAKYRITFIYDVEKYLETLEYIKNMKAKLFIPSHAAPTEDISSLAQYNIDCVKEIAEDIAKLCSEPTTFEELLAALFARYSLRMTFEQYALVGFTTRSYLAWLKQKGILSATVKDNRLFWQSVK